MSTSEAALIVAAVLLIGVPATYLQIRRALTEESTRSRLIREADERAEAAQKADPVTLAQANPAKRLPFEIEDHLVRFLIDNPDVADGFARLRQAIHDEQRKGDQQ